MFKIIFFYFVLIYARLLYAYTDCMNIFQTKQYILILFLLNIVVKNFVFFFIPSIPIYKVYINIILF
jgi:hypothetical protein